ncbi:MAG: hypothetical protein UT30_C0005G0035 [Candidatus Uhrbacteria bacterium GW2011_GWF2_39_13]|uniref:Uncharacterized protein n=1 Tax=Candidatus Uhrbacteria bacterium GW2011_GWF2_39_13 TaxID=1618995 RepID=A0A0G0QSR0_9BACT|nr:MAG: hypothetical protein UT30_C0005G0035 [Candidatus Uhrbacteria bacterium GW2011_GWF2_39_13]
MSEKLKYNGDEPQRDMFPPPEASTIDAKTASKLQKIIDGDQELQEAIARDDQELEMHRQHWVEYSEKEWGDRKRIPLAEFLKTHGIVERNKTHQKKVWDRKWRESVRWANDAERQFLATAAKIGGGKFVEVLQISLVNGGQITNSDAAVGSGTEVIQESIDLVIGNLDIVSAAPETVYIVHNHFDEYSKFTIPKDEEPKDGLVTIGGLSKRDIEFADNLWYEVLKAKTRVIIVAINERNLTFTYEAGTSEHRDWKNDPQ